VVSVLLFFVAPAIISASGRVRTSGYLLKMTDSVGINRTYVARNIDVVQRNAEIERWQNGSPEYKSSHSCPELLTAGQRFSAAYITPKKSIFWSQGIKVDEDGRSYGLGTVNLELVIIDALGFDLSKNPYCLNETIRFLVMMLLPFIIFYITAKFTKPLDKAALDRFYVKMKTPAFGTAQDDAMEMELSYQNPSRFDYKKMFPNTDWEFEKFDKTDIKGIAVSTFGGLILIAVLVVVAVLGKA
jgi:SSS family solute:Na+ symporter